MGWKAIAHSAIGTKYAKIGKPCQDYTNYLTIGDIIIGVVSDGAGSAKYSHIGSELAVETTINCLKKIIDYQRKHGYDWQKPTFQNEAIEAIFIPTFKTVLKALKRNADQSNQGSFENADLAQYGAVPTSNQEGYLLKDLACTLLIFVATPEWLTAMQIGDGFIVIKQPDTDDYELVFPPDQEEYAGVTTFVTSKNALKKMRVRVIPGKQEFICISTDGLERLAIDFKALKPHAPFFDPFKKGIKEDYQAEDQSTKIWLNSPEVNERVDDDKTLLICFYSQEVNSPPPLGDNDKIKRIKLGRNLSVSFPMGILSNATMPFISKNQQKQSPSPNEDITKQLKKIELGRILPVSFIAGILWNANYTLFIVNRNSQYRDDWISNLIIWLLILLFLLVAFSSVYKKVSNKKKKINKNIQGKQQRSVEQAARKTIFFHVVIMIVAMTSGALVYHLLWLLFRSQINY